MLDLIFTNWDKIKRYFIWQKKRSIGVVWFYAIICIIIALDKCGKKIWNHTLPSLYHVPWVESLKITPNHIRGWDRKKKHPCPTSLPISETQRPESRPAVGQLSRARMSTLFSAGSSTSASWTAPTCSTLILRLIISCIYTETIPKFILWKHYSDEVCGCG